MPGEFHEIEGANHNHYSVELKRELSDLTVDLVEETLAAPRRSNFR